MLPLKVMLAMLVLVFLLPAGQDARYQGWSAYAGDVDSSQYSSLRQINKDNVKKLKIAWTYPVQDRMHYFFNPIVVRGVMYVLAKGNSIVALEPETGKEIWTHATNPKSRLITNRGINYWESQDGSDRRLLFAEDNLLQAIDANTGKSIPSFGSGGSVDLRAGLGRPVEGIVLVQSTTPGRVFGNLLILGSATNQEYESAPGDIRAYDTRTGALVWTFHTIPHPGEFGYDTWPRDAWKTVGGANSWGEMSIDVPRGIVYVPTGSPKYNFYGANRLGANLFGDCLLALDARTGRRIWHFQMVHHDIWDYDAATAPKLLTLQHEGHLVDAVAEVSKQGFVWVFDRVTGQPLWPVEERPVPRSDMPGEEAWPTQPFPTNPPPFARQRFTTADLSPFLAPDERAKFADELQSARNQGLFTPPGLRNTVQMPGNNGGANWGSAAVDPVAGTLFVGSKDLPTLLKLVPEMSLVTPPSGTPEQRGLAVYRAKCQLCHHADLRGQPPAVPSLAKINSRLNQEQLAALVTHGSGLMPAFPGLRGDSVNFLAAYLFSANPVSVVAPAGQLKDYQSNRYRSGFGFMLTSGGLSPISPPWSSLTAYNLNLGTIQWKVPLGDVPGLGVKGTGMHFPKYGPVVTAGGLIFTGTRDKKVRALDEENGNVVWEAELETGMEGIPAVYEVAGREFIVFCAASQPQVSSTAGVPNGAYVAFALPD